MIRVLIIEDEETTNHYLCRMVGKMGYEAVGAVTLSEGLSRAGSGWFDVVLLDVFLPDGNGLTALPRLADAESSPEIIIITGADLPNGAQLAFESGAWDYLAKPVQRDELTLTLTRALHFREEKSREKQAVVLERNRIMGRSRAMNACLEMVGRAALSDASVLISGETGTGKELLARAVHENSRRAGGGFVVSDCASLPQNLVESVLFGHKKGAFTGADRHHVGLIKEADGGTLFLDEVGELPLMVQASFLRVLQERRFRPVGAEQEESSDFRVVAATNRDLAAMADKGVFREDLLYRLQAVTIDVPPLRERREDIRELTSFWIDSLCERYKLEPRSISPAFVEHLEKYEWPGNVRQLVNVLEQALFNVGEGATLYPVHLPSEIRARFAMSGGRQRPSVSAEEDPHEPAPDGAGEKNGAFRPLKEVRDEAAARAERDYLVRLMEHTAGGISEAAVLAGLSEPRLYALLKKHRVPRLKTY